MSLEGYTGPTSGRITVGGDRPATVERFYDAPLTAEEQQAVAVYRDLSPNGILRKLLEQDEELERLRFNEAVHRSGEARWKEAAQEHDAEIRRLRYQLAQYAPNGYSFPPVVQDLMDLARHYGWRVDYIWLPQREGDDGVCLEFQLMSGVGWHVKLDWYCTPGGKGRRIRSGLMRPPGGQWHDAPSVKQLKEIIVDNPVA